MVFLYQHEITSRLNVNQHRCVNNLKLSFETLYGWQTACVASASQKLRLPCRFYSQILHSFVRLSYCDSCEHGFEDSTEVAYKFFYCAVCAVHWHWYGGAVPPSQFRRSFHQAPPLLPTRSAPVSNSNMQEFQFARTDDQQDYISSITFQVVGSSL